MIQRHASNDLRSGLIKTCCMHTRRCMRTCMLRMWYYTCIYYVCDCVCVFACIHICCVCCICCICMCTCLCGAQTCQLMVKDVHVHIHTMPCLPSRHDTARVRMNARASACVCGGFGGQDDQSAAGTQRLQRLMMQAGRRSPSRPRPEHDPSPAFHWCGCGVP